MSVQQLAQTALASAPACRHALYQLCCGLWCYIQQSKARKYLPSTQAMRTSLKKAVTKDMVFLCSVRIFSCKSAIAASLCRTQALVSADLTMIACTSGIDRATVAHTVPPTNGLVWEPCLLLASFRCGRVSSSRGLSRTRSSSGLQTRSDGSPLEACLVQPLQLTSAQPLQLLKLARSQLQRLLGREAASTFQAPLSMVALRACTSFHLLHAWGGSRNRTTRHLSQHGVDITLHPEFPAAHCCRGSQNTNRDPLVM